MIKTDNALLQRFNKLREEVEKVVKNVNARQVDYSMPYLQNLPAIFNVSSDVIFRRIQKEELLKEELSF